MPKKSNSLDNTVLSKEQQYAADTLENFMRYLANPWRMMWVNFIAGIFRGLGAVIGASVVIGLMVWLLSLFVNLPYIGKYADQVGQEIQHYVDETNYNAEFDRLGDSLERIESVLENTGSNQPTEAAPN